MITDAAVGMALRAYAAEPLRTGRPPTGRRRGRPGPVGGLCPKALLPRADGDALLPRMDASLLPRVDAPLLAPHCPGPPPVCLTEPGLKRGRGPWFSRFSRQHARHREQAGRVPVQEPGREQGQGVQVRSLSSQAPVQAWRSAVGVARFERAQYLARGHLVTLVHGCPYRAKVVRRGGAPVPVSSTATAPRPATRPAKETRPAATERTGTPWGCREVHSTMAAGIRRRRRVPTPQDRGAQTHRPEAGDRRNRSVGRRWTGGGRWCWTVRPGQG